MCQEVGKGSALQVAGLALQAAGVEGGGRREKGGEEWWAVFSFLLLSDYFYVVPILCTALQTAARSTLIFFDFLSLYLELREQAYSRLRRK